MFQVAQLLVIHIGNVRTYSYLRILLLHYYADVVLICFNCVRMRRFIAVRRTRGIRVPTLPLRCFGEISKLLDGDGENFREALQNA